MSARKLLRLGTRGSALALWQAHHVRDRLQARHGDALEIEIVVIKTEGDRVLDRPLQEIGGKGVFVKDIEQRLLGGDIDFAVHSMKDLPSQLPAGLVIAATLEREDARDVLVSVDGRPLAAMREGARIGTGSARRAALVRRMHPSVEVVSIRGNVPTRLARVGSSGEAHLDGVLLAAAGLTRLGLAARVSEYLSLDAFCPAPCQGILALECRQDDTQVRAWLEPLSDVDAFACGAAERAFLRVLGAGCSTPVGCYAELTASDALVVRGVIVAHAGDPYFADTLAGPRSDAEALGRGLAERLLDAGAREVLVSVASAATPRA